MLSPGFGPRLRPTLAGFAWSFQCGQESESEGGPLTIAFTTLDETNFNFMLTVRRKVAVELGKMGATDGATEFAQLGTEEKLPSGRIGFTSYVPIAQGMGLSYIVIDEGTRQVLDLRYLLSAREAGTAGAQMVKWMPRLRLVAQSLEKQAWRK